MSSSASLGLNEELINVLIEQGKIVRIAKGIALTKEAFDKARERVVSHIREHGKIDVAGVRDLLATSRKYAVPFLEYLDQIDVTRRVGDNRVLGPKAR